MAKSPSYEELEQRTKALEKEITRLKKTGETVSMSEERLFQILQGSTIPTFVVDKQHVITHCNKAYENLTGISSEKMIGTRKQWMTFYPSERPVLADFVVDDAPVGKLRDRSIKATDSEAFIEDPLLQKGDTSLKNSSPT